MSKKHLWKHAWVTASPSGIEKPDELAEIEESLLTALEKLYSRSDIALPDSIKSNDKRVK